MRKSKHAVLALAGLLLLAGCSLFEKPELSGEFTVHKVYGDHMVLQCRRPIKISGTAEPGKAVTVTLADDQAVAVADEKGRWTAVLPERKPGGPFTVTVAGKDVNVEFSDVLIGEVWFCSGQSNMQMPVSGNNPRFRALGHEREVANAKYPKIRLYNEKRVVAPSAPAEETEGPGWAVCSPETVVPFSAAGYFFGRQLFEDLEGDVPIGLINSSWGGTRIEPWIPKFAYENAGREQELAVIATNSMSAEELKALYEKKQAESKQAYVVWEKRFYGDNAEAWAASDAWTKPEFDDSGWEDVALPGFFGTEYDGAAMFRKTVEIPQEWAGKELVLTLGPVDDCDETFFNGVKIGGIGADTPKYWETPRVYTIPAEQVKSGKAVIAVRASDLYGSGGILGPELKLAVKQASGQPIDLTGTWKSKVIFKADIKKIGQRPPTSPDSLASVLSPQFPSTLYNSMVAPWTVYPIRGVIWYQGESNAGLYEDYMVLFPLLINSWREAWHDPEMPFIFVQLSAFKANGAWPQMREVQTATLKLPNTGMAVTIDAGNPVDIHPANKQVVGYRLACEAGRLCYGRKRLSAGPYYERMEVEDGKIRIHFTNIGAGLKLKNGLAPKGFVIAGADGAFVPAEAKIDGDTVLVWSDKVKEPTAVRYAWSDAPEEINFYNVDDFPVCPFRTDTPDYLLQ